MRLVCTSNKCIAELLLHCTVQSRRASCAHLLQIGRLDTGGQRYWGSGPGERLLLHVYALEELDERDEGQMDLTRRSHVHQGVHKARIMPTQHESCTSVTITDMHLQRCKRGNEVKALQGCTSTAILAAISADQYWDLACNPTEM